VSELIGPGQSLASLAAHLRNATAEPAYPIGTALGQLALKARRDGRIGWARMSRLAPGEDIHQLSDTHRAKRRTIPRSPARRVTTLSIVMPALGSCRRQA